MNDSEQISTPFNNSVNGTLIENKGTCIRKMRDFTMKYPKERSQEAHFNLQVRAVPFICSLDSRAFVNSFHMVMEFSLPSYLIGDACVHLILYSVCSVRTQTFRVCRTLYSISI